MITLDSLNLPNELAWIDEFEWNEAVGNVRYTLGRGLIRQVASTSGGRPITLSGEQAWAKRTDIETLKGWAGNPVKEMSLTLHDGRIFTVCFRLWEPPVVSVEPVVNGLANPDGVSWYHLRTLKLATV